jgi:hypothetical protein
MQKATIDQPAYNQHGALLIKTSINQQGVISLYVTTGTTRIEKLSKAFNDREQAAAWYRHIAQAAEAGKAVYQIEWEIEALIAASVAVDVEQLAADLNADGDRYVAAEVEVHNTLVEFKDDVMAQADPNWKANFRAEVVQAAKRQNGMACFAQASTSRPANLTAAQHAIVTLAADNGGRIVRGGQPGQATSRQIIALNGCGLVDITYSRVGGTRAITGAQLTAKGFKHAGVDMERAA